MSVIAEWKIKGNDNREYTFDVFTLESKLPSGSGVYVLSKRTPNENNPDSGRHQVIYIGSSKSIRKRVDDKHEKWEESLRRGLNAISVYPIDETLMSIIEEDLIDRFNPPLNA